MIKIINSDQIECIHEAEKRYYGSLIVFIITDDSDVSNMRGRVYAVSSGPEEYVDICNIGHKLNHEEGYDTIITGSYEAGEDVAVCVSCWPSEND